MAFLIPCLYSGGDEGEGDGDEGDAAAGGDDDGAMDLEDLIERKDISSQLDGLVAMMGSSTWKERAEALETAERHMKDAANIKPDLSSDFLAAMKACLADKNMAVKNKGIAGEAVTCR
eukprot:sb/3476452/